MSTRMIENQRLAFLAQAQDASRRFQDTLVNLSDAQRAAMLAIVAMKTSTPIDVVFWADSDDAQQIACVVDAHLRRDAENHDAYQLGSGCLFQVVPQPGSETRYE